MDEILVLLLLLQKGLLSLLCQRIDDLLADETLPVCDVHNHADHQNTHNKNTLRIDKRAIDMSVIRSHRRLRARPLTSNTMGVVMRKINLRLRFSSSGGGLTRPASIASETYAGISEACSEHRKMKTYASQPLQTLRRYIGV